MLAHVHTGRDVLLHQVRETPLPVLPQRGNRIILLQKLLPGVLELGGGNFPEQVLEVLLVSYLLQHYEHDALCQCLEAEDPLLQLLVLPVQHDEAGHMLRGCPPTAPQSHAIQGEVPEVPIAVSVREDAGGVPL